MEWQVIVAVAVAIPIILFPVALIWYINFGGVIAAIRRARERRGVKRNKTAKDGVLEQEYKEALVETMERYPWMQ